jgi:hypothetical protein
MPSAPDTHCSKTTLIERQHVPRRMALRQDDDRRICQANGKLPVPFDNGFRGLDIGGIERLQSIGAASHFLEQLRLGRWTDVPCQQVIELRENERRQQQRP